MSRRQRQVDLGEAVSFDSVLTILTVLLVLRMVFLVPMVNLDKAKTEEARKDKAWDRTIETVLRIGVPSGAGAYTASQGVSGALSVQSSQGDSVVWVESVFPDSSIVVVRHQRKAGRYSRLHVQAKLEHPSCQYGRLEWSAAERQWFTLSDSVDYGERGVVRATLEAYRSWKDREAR